MAPRNYRILIIVATVVGFAAGLFDVMFPSSLPEAFFTAQRMQTEQQAAVLEVGQLAAAAITGGLVVLFVGIIVSTVGLFLFRPWAPNVALIMTVMTICITPLLGAMAQSGWAASLTQLAYMLWGAVLAATYWSPLKSSFVRVNRPGG